MKLTVASFATILTMRPAEVAEDEIKEVFSILGFKVKEYRGGKASMNMVQNKVYHDQNYEVHFQREYLFRISVEEDSRCATFSNEWINFGDGVHGVSFGGIDTVHELLRTALGMVSKLGSRYNGQLDYDEEESEYTQEEYLELIDFVNKTIFE